MTINQIQISNKEQLVKYFKSLKNEELKSLCGTLYIKRFVEYDLSFDLAYMLISNIITQRNMDSFTKARIGSYGLSGL